MIKYFLVMVMDETIKQKESKNKDIPNLDEIIELDWLSILNKHTSIMLLMNGVLKRSDILEKLDNCFMLIKNRGIIGSFKIGLSGIRDDSEKSELIETSKGNIRYIRLIIEYNSVNI